MIFKPPLYFSMVPTKGFGVAVRIFIFFYLLIPNLGFALTAKEILVISNSNFPHSDELADYYMLKRGVPSENVIRLRVTNDERCSRKEYNEKVAAPVRSYLEKIDPQGLHIRCLLTLYGVPLIVSQPEVELTPAEEVQMARLAASLVELEIKLQVNKNKGKDELKTLRDMIDETKKKISILRKEDQMSSLDSEIALVREGEYPLAGWVPNRYFIGFRGTQTKHMPTHVLMVSRLDAPSHAIVKRMIDDSVRSEMDGLKGKAYFDARWPDSRRKALSGYAFYDASIHRAAKAVDESGVMPVVLDDAERLFQPGECPDAALYCGWYSLANYVDAFRWVPGSVGFHIASAECQTLRDPLSKVWCKLMLEKGVAATAGPVGEPYVNAFPVPEVFFGSLVQGNLSLVECYTLASEFWSWRMVLIGDPLYRPFKRRMQ